MIMWNFQPIKLILFADDTSVFFSGDNIDSLTSEFNAELTKISSWLISNKLVLNTNKTSYMIFFLQTDQLIMTQYIYNYYFRW